MVRLLLAALLALSSVSVSGVINSGKQSGIIIGSGGKLAINGALELDGYLLVDEGGAVEFMDEESSLNMNDATYSDKNNGTAFSGTYHVSEDEDAEQVVRLKGSELMNALPGSRFDMVEISGADNTLTGDLSSANDITLMDSGTTLSLGPTAPLFAPVNLNGGTVNLLNDTSFAWYFFEGSGRLRSTKNISLQMQQATGYLACDQNLDIWGQVRLEFRNHVKLQNATWLMNHEGYIDGNGFTLDFDEGGSIIIPNNTLVTLADLEIKNLRQDSFIFQGQNSRIILSDCTVTLAQDVTYDKGYFIIYGETTFEMRDHTMHFTGTRYNEDTQEYDPAIQLYIIDAVLWYTAPVFDFFTENRLHIELQGSGLMRNTRGDMARESLVFTRDTLLYEHYLVDSVTRITFEYDEDRDICLDMNGYRIASELAGGYRVFIDTQLDSVTLIHGVLDSFSPRTYAFFLGDDVVEQTVPVVFGDGMRVTFGKDESLTFDITFDGDDIVVDGDNYVIDMGGHSFIFAEGSRVLFKDITLRNFSDDAGMSLLGPCAHVSFDNVTIELSGNFTWGNGAFTVVRDLEIFGGRVFTYASSRASSILTNGRLTLDEGVVFAYAPANGATDLIEMADSHANIVLDGATLRAPATGMQLTRGTISCKNNAVIESLAYDSEYPLVLGDGEEFSNNLTIKILDGQTLSFKRGYIVLADAVND